VIELPCRKQKLPLDLAPSATASRTTGGRACAPARRLPPGIAESDRPALLGELLGLEIDYRISHGERCTREVVVEPSRSPARNRARSSASSAAVA
jgi:hypothetical protein